MKYDHKRIRLEVNELTRELVGKYADTYEYPDGRIQVRHKGIVLPCAIFDPHQQRVTHAAITENKHLGAVLAHIERQQDQVETTSKVRPGSARIGYRKTVRRNDGWNSKLARRAKIRAAGQASEN